MEYGVLSPHKQEPAICPYPQPHHSSACPPFCKFKIHFNIILHTLLGLPSGLFTSGCTTKHLHARLLSSTRATRPAQLIFLDLIFRKVLAIAVFGEN